ncbi:MAG: hypothetical protein K9M15_02725 [Candidatus Marinimicrobia bacterium]|nr:hypothetical protein [Candidatus Neomarinimicrobiota bacterium]
MKFNEEKLKGKFAEILMSPQKNRRLERLIMAVYEALDKQRTSAQNKALHKDCDLIAEKLNDAGYTVQKVIKIDIPFTTTWVKEFMWKPIQKKMIGKTSTTELKKSDRSIEEIHDVLMQQLGEKLGIEYHEFPHDPEKKKEFEQMMMS